MGEDRTWRLATALVGMGTVVSRLSWVEWDAWMAIAARATRRFAQSAVAVLIAIYLGLHGFALVQVGAFLTIGAVGAACAGLAAGPSVGTALWTALGPSVPFLVSSALRMVQEAAGGQWHSMGVALGLGLFCLAYFLGLGPVLVVLLAAVVGMLIL